MDIIKMARELGAAIQQDERYLNFKKAREANEADKPLNDLIGELNLDSDELSAGSAEGRAQRRKNAGF